MINLPVIDQAQEIEGKRVLVRGDIDVPLHEGKIADDSRLQDICPTIEYLIQKNCQVVLAGHLGRPEGKVVPELSSKPVRDWFDAKGVQIQVLENLRFDPREELNEEGFARELAGKADVYVNEAFAVDERAHTSVVGVPKLLPHYAGFRLAKEIEVLSKVMGRIF